MSTYEYLIFLYNGMKYIHERLIRIYLNHIRRSINFLPLRALGLALKCCLDLIPWDGIWELEYMWSLCSGTWGVFWVAIISMSYEVACTFIMLSMGDFDQGVTVRK